jgi:hypothetical protein
MQKSKFNRVTLSLSVILALGLVAAMAPATSAAEGPIGVWKLNGNLKNAKGAPPKMIKVGSPTFRTTKVKGVTRKALRFAPTAPKAAGYGAAGFTPAPSDEVVGEGVRIKNIPVRARKTYTVDMLIKYELLDSYRRIMSFGPNGKDGGLYLHDGTMYLYDFRNPGASVFEAVPNKWLRVRVTRKGNTKMVKVYADGKKVLQFRDKNGVFKLKKGVAEFFKDNGPTSTEHAKGFAANIRLWNRVVTP